MKMGRPKKLINYKGENYNIDELVKKYGLNRWTIRTRLARGQDLERPFGQQDRKNRNIFKIDGKLYTTAELEAFCKISAETIRRHMRSGTLKLEIQRFLNKKINFEIVQGYKAPQLIIEKLNKRIADRKTAPKLPTIQEDNDAVFYIENFERVQKIVRLYKLKQATVDRIITQDRWTVYKVQKGPARYNYILRTDIPEFVKACREKPTECKVYEEQPKNLGEMKKLHPLVKDERFFKVSFFPHLDLPICYDPKNYEE